MIRPRSASAHASAAPTRRCTRAWSPSASSWPCLPDRRRPARRRRRRRLLAGLRARWAVARARADALLSGALEFVADLGARADHCASSRATPSEGSMTPAADRSILDRIASPPTCGGWPASRWEEVTQALRAEIVDKVSKTGGHLASSIGAGRDDHAIHAVFDTPKRRLVLDVGHRATQHKLLTPGATASSASARRAASPSVLRREGRAGSLRRRPRRYLDLRRARLARAFQHQGSPTARSR